MANAPDFRIQDLPEATDIGSEDNFLLEQADKAKRVPFLKFLTKVIDACAEKFQKKGVIADDLKNSESTWSSKKISDLLSKKADTTAVPKVPSWAMQPKKPSYTAAEVGALPAETKIPGKTSDLTNDSNFITDKAVHQSCASAIEKTVSEGKVSVDDVSPLVHDVRCRVSGVADPTVVTVSRYGKNLFDLKKTKAPQNGTILTVEGNKVVATNVPATEAFLLGCSVQVEKNTDYSVSFDTSTKKSVGPLFVYKDHFYGSLIGTFEVADSGNHNTAIFNSGDNITLFLGFLSPEGSHSSSETVSNIQLEKGDETSFSPCMRTDFIPSPYGTVSGMTSLSPSMTILTDTPGAVVELTYNQDPTVVIKKLTDRVSELENTQVKEAL